MSLLVTGSLGIDTVATPHGTATEVLGGSAVYFAFAARLYCDVRLVGVVGEDFPAEFRRELTTRGIDLAGLETRPGSRTFRWSGRYTPDMNERETLNVELNVLAEAGPKVPPAFTDSDVVFLANTHPALQRELRSVLKNPRLTVCDTMDHWIETARGDLIRTLSVVDGLILNDFEARQLTSQSNLVAAGQRLLAMGPRFVVIKKGEHGAMLVTPTGVTAIPAFPTTLVKDPTGAGDSFAGGMLGYLSACGEADEAALRRSLVHGTVAASFTIEDFSLGRLRDVTREQIDRRVERFVKMLRLD